MKRVWCAALLLCCTACSHHNWLSNFSYTNLPSGYHWVAMHDLITHDVVYYAKDPSNGDTLYVGPGNVFYHYHHPGRIGPRDLSSVWDPHNAPPALAQGSANAKYGMR